MNKLWIVGIGPGHEDYLLPIARKKIDLANYVFGSKRHLALVTEKEKTYVLSSPLEKSFNAMKEKSSEGQVALLVSGDTGFYSMLELVKKYFDSGTYEAIPGISSLSYMFAKLSLSYNSAFITSWHGRPLNIEKIKAHDCVGLLTDKDHSPEWIRKQLNHKKGKVHVGANLSYGDEKIMTFDLNESIPDIKETLCVVVIEYE